MKHSIALRLACGALSGALALASLPAPALAEAARALSAQGAGTWSHDTGAWAYRLPSGLATGWQNVDGTWYLFDAAGTMLTGWQKDARTWYYLGSSGRMYAGRWLCEGETWYYLLPSGAMATGWAFLNGAWYHFSSTGVMATNTEVDGCWLRGDGAWDDSARPEDPEPDQPDRATLTVEATLDPAATEALVRVESDAPFAEDLGDHADLVTPGGDIENYEVTSVRRTSATTAEIALAGEFQAETEDDPSYGVGAIVFAQGSFARDDLEGTALVDVARQGATVLDTEHSFANGAFVLSLDLGSAQLPEADDASAFSFPANQNIKVTSATNQPYGNSAAISVEAPGDTPYEQFCALDEALTQGGVAVAGTTAGDIVAWGEDPQRESALSYVAPQLTAYIERGADGKGYQLLEDGTANINLIVRVVSTGGDPNLSGSNIVFAADGLVAGASFVLNESPYQAEVLVESLSPDDLANFKDVLGFDSTEELLDALVYTYASQAAEGVAIGGGITNRWGVELPADEFVEATAYNLAGLGETGQVEEGAFSQQGADVQALAVQASDPADDDYARAAEAFKDMGDILQIAGTIASAFGEGGNPAAVVSGVGMLFNFMANMIGKGVSTSWDINDVMDRVIEMDAKLDAITAQLGDITHQLDRLEASLDYKTQVGKLTTLAQQAMRYRPWVMRALNRTAGADDRQTYELSDELETSVTGQALQDLCDQTSYQSAVTGGGSTTAKVALDLAYAITGNANTQQSSAVTSFFDYTATCVNWEPEAYYARRTFTAYVGNAFVYAYCAAMNELNHQIYAADTTAKRDVLVQTREELLAAAQQVNALIGTNGSLVARTTDRTDGAVLCTVNNKLYKKSSNGLATFYAPLRVWSQKETKDTFDDLLKDREQDKVKKYANQSTVSRADFETMAKREGFVRTQPGFHDVTSIRKEFEAVGLLPANFTYPNTSGSGSPHDYNDITWKDVTKLGRALVGDAKLSDKSDAASRYHKRWYSAEMYDIDNNRALGSQELYYLNVDYMVVPARWKVYLTIQAVFEMKAA